VDLLALGSSEGQGKRVVVAAEEAVAAGVAAEAAAVGAALPKQAPLTNKSALVKLQKTRNLRWTLTSFVSVLFKMSAQTPATVDIFEVYKVGSVPRESLQSSQLDALQRKFTILAPVTSVEQMKAVTALATVPSPGHIVVDQSKFKEMFAEKAKEAALKSSSVVMAQTDKAIDSLKQVHQEEVKAIVQVVRETLEAQRDVSLQSIRAAFADQSLSPTEREARIVEAIQKQTEVVLKVAQLLGEKDGHLRTFQ